ncbi:hypothetical protein PISMIDRAFT_18120 [Pisolithus microcarpus 441]|uniref:Uncharacterized protein n=1 Tax=Pisolithus microcarpus 441 TaxID=765257 RepID=A0A0C9YZG1_9AGAM|nr:hypothetical protein PISMIDRAFT_18120 [Pisolithus microcarpus 441]
MLVFPHQPDADFRYLARHVLKHWRRTYLTLVQFSSSLINSTGPASVINARNVWWTKSPLAPEPNLPAIPASPTPAQPDNISIDTPVQGSPITADEAVVISDALAAAATDSTSAISELTNVIPPLQHGDLYDQLVVTRRVGEVLHGSPSCHYRNAMVLCDRGWDTCIETGIDSAHHHLYTKRIPSPSVRCPNESSRREN